MRYRDLLVLVVLALVACGDDGPGGDGVFTSIDDDPRAGRYPAERLPWTAAPDTNAPTGLVSEDPVGHVFDVLQPRAAVLGYGTGMAARVVAIVPVADDGLVLAVAGIDHPWEKVPVAPLDATQIGALDAVVDATDTVHLFVREKAVPGQLRYFRWREGEPVVEQPRLPAIPNALAVRYAEDCTDVSAAIDRHGRPAVTFTAHTFSERATVYLARQGADGAWTTEVMATSYSLGNQQYAEAGCRTLLRTDEAGYLRFATLHRTFPSSFSTNERLRWHLPKSTVNAAETGDGRFVTTTLGVKDQDAGTDIYKYSGLFDLHVDSLGVIWASPYAVSYGIAVAASLADGFVVPQRDQRDRGVVISGKLFVDECRGLMQFVEATPEVFSPTFAFGTGCLRNAGPPVASRGAELVEPVHVVWTRGERPFFAGLCVDAAGTIALCGPTVQAPEAAPQGGVCRPTPDELLPALTAQSIQPGAEIAADAPWRLEVEPDLDGSAWVLRDLDTVHAQLSSEDIPASVVLDSSSPPPPLQAGHRYRAEKGGVLPAVYIGNQRTCAYPWLYPLVDRRSPEVAFTVAGPRPTDPRELQPALRCELIGTRASDGVCEVVADVPYVDGGYDLTAPFTGTLVTGSGTSASYPNVQWIAETNRVQWRFLAPVDETAVYTLPLPPSVTNYWGGPAPDPIASTIRLRFPLAPLRVISTTVTDGATDVALDVELGFELSMAVSLEPVRLGPTGGTLTDIFPQQVSATAWRVPHATLQAGTAYTLEVPDVTVSNGEPFRLRFTTAL